MVELLYKFPGGPIAFQIFAAVAIVVALRLYYNWSDKKDGIKRAISSPLDEEK